MDMENYNLSSTPPKMNEPTTLTIDAIVQTQSVVKREIELPYFCKNGSSYFMVEHKDKVTEVYFSGTLCQVIAKSLWLCEKDVAQAEPITEDEFAEQLRKSLLYITSPKKQTA